MATQTENSRCDLKRIHNDEEHTVVIGLPLGRGTGLTGHIPAPEELIVIVLLLGWAGVGSRAELPVCGGAFRLAGVPVHRIGGRRFLRTVPSSTGRDRESARFYGRWR